MLVPIDAWNKMLNQLGNLHEAGQQLAEARERAAKAETEAVFLRERLAEMRELTSDNRRQTSEPSPRLPGGRGASATQGGPQSRESEVAEDPASLQGGALASDHPDTTSYWRYLTTGWRNRQKRR